MPKRKNDFDVRSILFVLIAGIIWASNNPDLWPLLCVLGAALAALGTGLVYVFSLLRTPIPRTPAGGWTAQRLNALDPYEFERVITNLYNDMGYKAKHTGRAGDGGVDIVVHDRDGDKHVIQCKHRTVGNVGAGDIRDLIGTVARERAIQGVLCTNADFSGPARNTAEGQPILLYNGEQIVAQLNRMAARKQQ
jgi:restriction system protein